jgi:hypothetical protein
MGRKAVIKIERRLRLERRRGGSNLSLDMPTVSPI